MNFTQMHERLRLELLRRIQRGTVSVSLLARQTGFGQAHLSNFLRSRRQLSLEAMDRILAAQHLTVADLLPSVQQAGLGLEGEDGSAVPVVSHAVALFEPVIRPSAVQSMLPEAIVLIDRHYNSLLPYRPSRPNLYAVRQDSHLTLRYVDFLASRLVLRPQNIAFPVALIEVDPGESPNNLLVGRIALILNEL